MRKNLIYFSFILLGILFSAETGRAQCSPDVTPPNISLGEYYVIKLAPQETKEFEAVEANNGSYDDCSSNLTYYIQLGLAAATDPPPATNSLTFSGSNLGIFNVSVWAVDESGNYNLAATTVEIAPKADPCAGETEPPTLVTTELTNIYIDTFLQSQISVYALTFVDDSYDNCTGPDDLVTVVRRVDGSGNPLTAFGPVLDLYASDAGQTFFVEVQVTDLAGNSSSALTTVTVVAAEYHVYANSLSNSCPLLYVDLVANRVTPCEASSYYINYFNGGPETVANTYVDVFLDDALSFTGSTLPGTDLGNNKYRFFTGTLNSAQQGRFRVDFNVDCNAPVGATHCSKAQVFPQSLCSTATPQWDGANVSVSGYCQNDSIFLSITNIGALPNAQFLEYIVVEDVLMRDGGQFKLNPGETLPLVPFPADGSTVRLQAQQEPGFPFSGSPWVAVEGCAGLVPGMVTIFPTNDGNPFEAYNCIENNAAALAIDLLASPKGYGNNHYIKPDNDLTYTVHFQNEGNTSSDYWVISDTLSTLLDGLTVRPGASSHPYTLYIANNRVLALVFDSLTLAAGEKGFVQFEVSQKATNQVGDLIYNRATLYMDNQAPITTAQTFHEISNNFLEVSSVVSHNTSQTLKASPNPASGYFMLEAKGVSQPLHLRITDVTGREIQQQSHVLLPLRIDTATWPDGVYFFQIAGPNGLLWTGKVEQRK